MNSFVLETDLYTKVSSKFEICSEFAEISIGVRNAIERNRNLCKFTADFKL